MRHPAWKRRRPPPGTVAVMRRAAEQVHDLLRAAVAAGSAAWTLARALLVAAVLAALADTATAAEPALVAGVLGALLCAWAVARHSAVVLPAVSGSRPVVAARDHHRALARRAVPRLRDPDAPGRTRSRAPSELFPAVS